MPERLTMPTRPAAGRHGDLAGGDADVALAGADDARAVRAEQPDAREVAHERVVEPASSWAGMPSVMHTMNGDAGLGRLQDRGRTRPCGGTTMNDGVGARGGHGLRHRGEHRDALDVGAGLPGVAPATTWVP